MKEILFDAVRNKTFFILILSKQAMRWSSPVIHH